MDNQQRRLARLGWAGGIIDGEGCVSFGSSNDFRRSQSRLLYPSFKMCNTSQLLLDEFCGVLKENDLAWLRRDVDIRNPKHKPQQVILIYGMKRMLRFITVMQPFTLVKWKQMEVIRAYCDHRLARPYHSSLDSYEIWLLEYMRELNQRGVHSRSETNTPDTARPAVMIEPVLHAKAEEERL